MESILKYTKTNINDPKKQQTEIVDVRQELERCYFSLNHFQRCYYNSLARSSVGLVFGFSAALLVLSRFRTNYKLKLVDMLAVAGGATVGGIVGWVQGGSTFGNPVNVKAYKVYKKRADVARNEFYEYVHSL